jgi:hypothetical protein
MSALRGARRWLPFGVGLAAGLVLAQLLASGASYPTPLIDLLQALDFAFG